MRALVLALLLSAGLAGCTDDGGGGTVVDNACTQHPKYGSGNPLVHFQTGHGNLTAEIFVDKVPVTGMNFVKLVEDGKFNGTKFHRIIADFMMQGGDYTLGNGGGGAAHEDCALEDGDIPDEFRADLKHTGKGILSMANTGQSESGSSQFFITFEATSHLDAYEGDQMKPCGQIMPGTNPPRYYSCHAVFGKVVEGLATLDAVNADARAAAANRQTIQVDFIGATVEWP